MALHDNLKEARKRMGLSRRCFKFGTIRMTGSIRAL